MPKMDKNNFIDWKKITGTELVLAMETVGLSNLLYLV